MDCGECFCFPIGCDRLESLHDQNLFLYSYSWSSTTYRSSCGVEKISWALWVHVWQVLVAKPSTFVFDNVWALRGRQNVKKIQEGCVCSSWNRIKNIKNSSSFALIPPEIAQVAAFPADTSGAVWAIVLFESVNAPQNVILERICKSEYQYQVYEMTGRWFHQKEQHESTLLWEIQKDQ